MSIPDTFDKGLEEFGRRVDSVADDQWTNATPCSDWDVRAVVNHVVSEMKWVGPLLEGKTIEQVGDRLDGDLLGSDPKAAWSQAAKEARAAVEEPGVLERTVHLSFGDFPGRAYLGQGLIDLTIHSWDLASGIGADQKIAPELVDFVYAELGPQVEAWRQAGAFGDEVKVPDDADTQTKLLGMVGRQPS
jgi:uncharacterized protein (TIGR03086 family)